MNSINKKKAPFYFYLILFFIPILFFVLLEVGLRIFNYGKNLDAFIELSDYNPDLLFINPDIPFRYVSGLYRPPGVNRDAFKKVKSDSTFRVFVMGGSSAAGFPYAYNATFPKYIERKLKLLYPYSNIEMINLGITAHNSYTVADLAEEVAEQKPDLVIIYAGHNEYYGVLGVGSSVKFGNSVAISKMMIELNKIKTYQLLKEFMAWLASFFSYENNRVSIENQTLMSRMIGESKIYYESDLFIKGIDQFRENMDEFLGIMRRNKVDVLFGNLVSNFEQVPFISISSDKQLNADSLFNLAQLKLEEGMYQEAKTNYQLAKDYDALRFRAPEKINEVIEDLCKRFDVELVDIVSNFESVSEHGIIGYNLMVDHLHPNIEGYDLMAESFFEAMEINEYLPNTERLSLDEFTADSLMKANFPYTRIDSIVSAVRLKKLLGSYPFVKKGIANFSYRNYHPQNFIDSLAIAILTKQISWRDAHQEAAEWYYSKGDIDQFIKEMKCITSYLPYAEIPYALATSKLVNAQRYDDALYFLTKLHKLNPNDYTYKWIGSIALQKGKYKKAIANLLKSSELNNKDAQVFYNLSGAYFNDGQIDKAIESIEKCFQLNDNYPRAKQFYEALKQLKSENAVQ